MTETMKNGSGYFDSTAYEGIKNIVREEAELDNRIGVLIHIIKETAELSGFHIENRIVIRHIESGKIFR